MCFSWSFRGVGIKRRRREQCWLSGVEEPILSPRGHCLIWTNTFWHLDKYVWPFCQIHLENFRNKFDRNILWRNEYWAEEGTVWSEAWFTEKKKKEIQLLAKYWLGNNQINFNFKKVKNQCLIANSIGNNIKWDSQRMQRLKGEEFVITSLRLLHPTDVTQTVHIQI